MLTRMDMRHCAKHLGFLTDSSFLFCGLFHQFGHNIIVADFTMSSEINPESAHEFADQGDFRLGLTPSILLEAVEFRFILPVAVPTTEVPIIRKGPTTRSGSRVIRAGFAEAVQELLAQEQTGFKQLLIQELADLKLEDTSEPLEAPDSIHSSQFSSIDHNEAGLTISTFILNPSNQLASGSEI
ncbi:hypothetical protein F2Q70_00039379 [Brassica cretica]|uniref:Uncharacterized protein n=1 Tax=Brassica cretica TaxID=69181 RepID=A0A8S9K9G6_BRACR|nr:hypothetical protein F2Q70_00039379 [Brassica cretica]